MRLDHLALACSDLDAGSDLVAQALGISPGPGGRHDRYATENRLLGLEDDLYLEVIAPQASKTSTEPRWFGLDAFEGAPRLVNWICAVDDLDAALSQSPVPAGRPVELVRGDLHWRIAVPEDGSLPMQGGWPTLIEWGGGVTPPGQRLENSHRRLLRLEVRHPDAAQLATQVPLKDDRVVFLPSNESSLRAEFETPSGIGVLE